MNRLMGQREYARHGHLRRKLHIVRRVCLQRENTELALNFGLDRSRRTPD